MVFTSTGWTSQTVRGLPLASVHWTMSVALWPLAATSGMYWMALGQPTTIVGVGVAVGPPGVDVIVGLEVGVEVEVQLSRKAKSSR